MTITPEQASELLDGATPGPWSSHHDEWEDENGIECEDFYVIGGTDGILSTENFDPDNHYPVANTTLAAAAPDMAETIAGMAWQHAVEVYNADAKCWIQSSNWISNRKVAEQDIDAYSRAYGGAPTRLVRRLVGPTETAGDLV